MKKKPLRYEQIFKKLNTDEIFRPEIKNDKLSVIYNLNHPYVRNYLNLLPKDELCNSKWVKHFTGLLFLSFARVECSKEKGISKSTLKKLRDSWGNTLAGFLE